MKTIDIEFGPPPPSYDTFEAAVAAANVAPEQLRADRESKHLIGSSVEDVRFGTTDCVITFSNGQFLHALARAFHVEWRIGNGVPPSVQPVPVRRLRFPRVGEQDFDPGSIIQVILGAAFARLGYSNRSFLVYTRGNEIFSMSAYRERGGGDLLYAFFDI
ncbi:MAG: hypothetical protein AAF545_06035 [Pseudomonadota bacterium]